MSSTRERALRAAVRLVGRQGVRALTHARVDAEARLPRGSTSNHFRTRAALVTGVIGWIAEQERAALSAAMTATGPGAGSMDEVVDAFCAILDDLTNRHADRTRARLALFLEMTGDPAVQAPLRAERVRFEDWTRDLLAGLGAADPDTAARAFLAFGNGLVLHRLTVDPDASLRRTVEMAVRVCLVRSD